MKFTTFLKNLKTLLVKAAHVLLIAISLMVGIAIGYYYNLLTDIKIDKKPKVITKSEANIAVDENSNLLIINRGDGTYVMYEDSIGITIFNIYARNMYGQHSPDTDVNKK